MISRLAHADSLCALLRVYKDDLAKSQVLVDSLPEEFRNADVVYTHGMIQLRIERVQADLDALYAEECA